MQAGAKNNLNAYLAIYSTVCVLWAAVGLTKTAHFDGWKQNSGSSLPS
jgi:hypothetical protein